MAQARLGQAQPLTVSFVAANQPDQALFGRLVDAQGRAIYFSRSPIPYPRDGKSLLEHRGDFLLHFGIYAYRRDFLLRLAGWPVGRLERIEKLEQLRVLERRCSIAVGVVDRAAVGIDTPADYEAFVNRIQAAAR